MFFKEARYELAGEPILEPTGYRKERTQPHTRCLDLHDMPWQVPPLSCTPTYTIIIDAIFQKEDGYCAG